MPLWRISAGWAVLVTMCWPAAAPAYHSVSHASPAPSVSSAVVVTGCPPAAVVPAFCFGVVCRPRALAGPMHSGDFHSPTTPGRLCGGRSWARWVALGPGTEVAPGGPSNSLQVPGENFRFCMLMIASRRQCAACGPAGVGRCYITCYGGVGAAGGSRCPSGPHPVPIYRMTLGVVRGDLGPGWSGRLWSVMRCTGGLGRQGGVG